MSTYNNRRPNFFIYFFDSECWLQISQTKGQNKILSCDPTPCLKTPISSVLDKTQACAKWRFPPFDRSDTFTLQHISFGCDGISLLVWLDLFDTWDEDENIPRSIFLIFFPFFFLALPQLQTENTWEKKQVLAAGNRQQFIIGPLKFQGSSN